MIKYTTVDNFLNDLEADKRAQVSAIRQTILSSNAEIQEHIKWNAPSYVYNGEDRITFNLLNKEGAVKIVLHMGALRKEDKKAAPILNDTTGIISWISDIRGMITFRDLADIDSKKKPLAQIVNQWLSIV